MALSHARGRPAPHRARPAARAARARGERRVPGRRRRARERLGGSDPGGAARWTRRHGVDPRARRGRVRFLRDDPWRSAALLAASEGTRELRMKIVERPYNDNLRRMLIEG